MSTPELNIIKIGGNVIDNESLLDSFLKDFAALKGNKILIHGGGKLATELSAKLGIATNMVEGRRITDKETLKVVTMVYAGLVNKTIAAKLNALGCKTVGLCGADAQLIPATKRANREIDYGYVGDINAEHINVEFINSLMQQSINLVVAPITADKEGQLLNTNADSIAAALSKAVSRQFKVNLVYCFEKAGVLKDVNNDDSLVSSITQEIYAGMKAQGEISAGMIPKLDNAFDSLHHGVESVIIGHARQLPELLKQKDYAGTRITL